MISACVRILMTAFSSSFGILIHPHDLAIIFQLSIAVRLHIAPILFRDAGLAHSPFLSRHACAMPRSRSAIWSSFREVLARYSVHSCVRAQYLREALEFGGGLLVLRKGATVVLERVQLGHYFFRE